MKAIIWSLSLAAMTAWSFASPIVIDKATFQRHGGDVNNVATSIMTHNNELRASSYETPWLVVGKISACTATWLGEKDGWTYVLTAAHCVASQGTETAISETFVAPAGGVIASGNGTMYIPQQWFKRPEGMERTSADIAILKLPTRNPMVDKAGRSLERPIINDALDETGRDVIFVGSGSWGVGSDGSGEYGPSQGERRLYGRSRIDRIFSLEHGIAASYKPVGSSPYWAQPSYGDSGSAWWQIREGKPVIIATTGTRSEINTRGPRVSKWVAWIKSIYPEVRILSAEKPQGCIVSLHTKARYCMSPGTKALSVLPRWIYRHQIYVDAAPGTAVELSDVYNLSYNRVATFVGTVENDRLKSVKAANGENLDFSGPVSMRVVKDTTPVGCITSLTTSARYCLPPEQQSGGSLPSWIYAHDVQVEAAPGTAVILSDSDNLPQDRLAMFSGFVQNWEMTKVRAPNGEDLDFSRPKSMLVVQQ